MKIAIATDHAGLASDGMYESIKQYLTELGHDVADYGPGSLDMEDDYPEFMFAATNAVASGLQDVAILFGGSGQGEAMAANRVRGIRCTLFYGLAIAKQSIDAEGHMSTDPYEILRLSRQHNHANALSLSARFLSLDEIKQAIAIWLQTPYSEEPRHYRRVKQLG